MKITMISITIYLLILSLAGCGSATKAYFEEASPSTETMPEATESTGSNESAESREPTESAVSTEAADSLKECCVYVCGAVNKPDVYILPAGSRVYEAIRQAGGLTEDASESSINQAEEITDGQMIQVPTMEEAANQRADVSSGAETAQDTQESDGKLNLNTADSSELMTLPGIGKAKADSILSYREKAGGFASVEEIMNVEGIKEGIYTKIKDYITVN